jgi:putative endonuclease
VTAARRRLGQAAEDEAAARLEAAGMRLLHRNVRIPGIRGELDIVALDSDGTLVFVEVKGARPGTLAGPERPAIAVGPRKRAKIRALTRAWLASDPAVPRFRAIRFDVIGLRLDATGRVSDYDHIRAAF